MSNVLSMQNGPAYCEAFLTVLRNVTKEEAVQYMLALIDDMLAGESFGSALPAHMRLGPSPALPFKSFLARHALLISKGYNTMGYCPKICLGNA